MPFSFYRYVIIVRQNNLIVNDQLVQKKPAEAGLEFLLRGMSYPKRSLGH